MKEREKKVQPWESHNKVDEAVEVPMLCHTSDSEVVQILLKQTWNLLRKHAWDLHKNMYKVKGHMFRHVKNSSPPSNRTSQGQVVASRSDCEHEGREVIADSGASLHKMSENEITSGGLGTGVSKACQKQAAADSRGSRTCLSAITLSSGGTGRSNVLPWYRQVGVVTAPPARRMEEEPGCLQNRYVATAWYEDGSPHLSLLRCFQLNEGCARAGC